MYSVCDNYISLTKTQQQLEKVIECYNDMVLPGCGGSVDVVHVKWSQ